MIMIIEIHEEVIKFLEITGVIYQYPDGTKGYRVNNCLYKTTNIKGLYTTQFIEQNND